MNFSNSTLTSANSAFEEFNRNLYRYLLLD